MNINATLFVQVLVFITFVALTVKYIWPLLDGVLEKRRKEIADGLAAAAQGKKDLELAGCKSREMLEEAKAQAAQVLEQAGARANRMIEDAKQQARAEGERLMALTQEEVQQHYHAARAQLMKQVSQLVIAGAEKVLQREVDKASNDHLIDTLIREEIP